MWHESEPIGVTTYKTLQGRDGTLAPLSTAWPLTFSKPCPLWPSLQSSIWLLPSPYSCLAQLFSTAILYSAILYKSLEVIIWKCKSEHFIPMLKPSTVLFPETWPESLEVCGAMKDTALSSHSLSHTTSGSPGVSFPFHAEASHGFCVRDSFWSSGSNVLIFSVI